MPSRWWVQAKGMWMLMIVGWGGIVDPSGRPECWATPQAEVTEKREGSEQDDQQDSPAGIRIRGRLTVETVEFNVEFDGFELTLEEIVAAPELPLPTNFQQLSLEQRQKWFQEFQASDAGKQYQDRLAKADAARRKRTVRADAEGKFSFNDGFSGTCGLFGQREFEVAGRTYIADFFAEIPVAAGIRFMDLGDLPLTVRRLLKPGEPAPDLRLRAGEDASEASLFKVAKLSGKPALLCFWTRDSLERIREPLDVVLQKKSVNLTVVGVNLDEPSAELQQFLEANPLTWMVLKTSGLPTAPVAVDYGILAIPGFCLLDAQGKVVLNDDGFFEALSQAETTMESVITAALSGR